MDELKRIAELLRPLWPMRSIPAFTGLLRPGAAVAAHYVGETAPLCTGVLGAITANRKGEHVAHIMLSTSGCIQFPLSQVQLSAALSGLPAEPEEWRAPERDPMAGVALLLGGGCCLLMPVELLLMGIAAIFRSRWGAFVLFVVVAVGFVAYFGGLL